MVLTERENGRSVTVSVGTVVTVRLPEAPTTGYRWAVEAASGVELIADRTAASGAIGGEGMRELEFRVSKPGRHDLRLKRWRDWEGDASVIDRFAVTIVST
jgi:inhibitor of cysteine peptidase